MVELKKIHWLFFFLFLITNFDKIEAVRAESNIDSNPKTISSNDNNKIKVISIEGNTIFNRTELQSVITDFIDKPITLQNIQQISIAITSFYREKGYTTSEAYPESFQNLEQGKVQIVVVEGVLEAIEIEGLSSINDRYIEQRLMGVGNVLNVNKLVTQLRLLESNRLIESIQAKLKQGNRPNGSILSLIIEEKDNFNLELGIDNYGAFSSGEIEGDVIFTVSNLTGNGDRFQTQFIGSEGSKQVIIDYSYPINPLNGILTFHYEAGNSEVIQEPFKSFNIEGDYQKAFIQWRQPVVKTLTDELVFSTEIGFTQSRSFLDNRPFSFFADIPDSGYSTYTWRLAAEYFKSTSTSAFALRSELTIGTDSIEATEDPFIIIRGQAQYLKNFSPNWLLSVSLSGQLTRSSLEGVQFGILPSEQFPLGGINTVPGYSLNFLRGDNGIVARSEIFYSILNREDWGKITLKPFVAIGTVGNENGPSLNPDTLASMGVNLNWNWQGWQTDLGFAYPLIRDNISSDFQNEFYFSVRKSFFF